MTPLFVITLVLIAAGTHGQVYLAPPSGYQTYPQVKQDPFTNQNVANEETTDQNKPETQLDDPYATMEIYKQLKRVPSNHKPVHVPVQVKTRPEVQVQSSESKIQVQGTPAQQLGTLDYFSVLGGSPPEAAEQSEDYSTIFPSSSPLLAKSGYTSGFKSGGDPFPSSSPLQGFTGEENYGSNFPSQTSEGEIQGRPSRYYPVQQNNFSPLTDFSPSGFTQNSNIQKLEEIVDDAVLPKSRKPKKKLSSKLKKFPKKYRSYPKKQKRVNPSSELIGDFGAGGIKLSPTSDFSEDFSLDSLKNKRRIPVSYKGPSAQLTNPYSSDLSSYTAGKGSHSDFTSGTSDSSGFKDGSSGSSGFTADSGATSGFTGGSSASAFSAPSGGAAGDRMQFQMVGMDGPHSYKFGYDTGKGHNRHFRYEERDNHGKVKGHYGFYDQDGKMSMIHYEADPHTGYKAGPYHHPENHHDYDYNHQNSDYSK